MGRAAAWGAVVIMVFAGIPAVAGTPWPQTTPEEAGLDRAALGAFRDRIEGRGCVVRHGQLVFTWGDAARPGDVASAVKPVFTHFLLRAMEMGLIPSLDEKVVRWEPRLEALNAALGHKDRDITWRHLASQTSGYGVAERPGTAFCYNDWQMALFVDLLFNRVYGVPWSEVDAKVLHPFLTDRLGCEDGPTLLGLGAGNRAGRLSVSPRDFARFGQLYLQRGMWRGQRLLREDLLKISTTSPLPASLPRAGRVSAAMLEGQRTLGSQKVPDNQTDHFGSYSWLWWVNGVERDGRRHWPDLPPDSFAALGHGGIRGLMVIPCLDLVVSWNDARISSPADENAVFGLLVRAVGSGGSRSSTGHEAHLGDPGPGRLRILVETDAGGDPDDEQSLVRFLLYANEWDVAGLVANRPQARPGENRNPERTGLGIVRRMLDAYGACWTNLAQHDPRYPTPEALGRCTVAGYNTVDDAVNLIMAAVDSPDPRPLWYSDWGTDHGAATNNLRRALDRVLLERGQEGYSRFKSRLRLVSADALGPHTRSVAPPFPLWVDTFRPEIDRKRWYHRFSALTARAGGFDLVRDCLTGHGPLGALYPTNTTHGQKEGDSMTFLYLVPTGMNDPEHPGWGSWAGRYTPMPEETGRAYFWAGGADGWGGTTNRDNTLLRWAADLQNDFRARLDWCVKGRTEANHPPVVKLDCPAEFTLVSGAERMVRPEGSMDPDGDALALEWIVYPEAGTWRGAVQAESTAQGALRLVAPEVTAPETLHLVLRATDRGDPPLSRYERVIATVLPRTVRRAAGENPNALLKAQTCPLEFADDLGQFKSPFVFQDGRRVRTTADWVERRKEIESDWRRILGSWPAPAQPARVEVLGIERRENFTQERVRVNLSAAQAAEGWLLVPDGPGRFPAVLVPYYEPETSIGRGQPLRDFALQLTRRGFVTLSISSPGGDARLPDLSGAACQPLAYLAFVADRCAEALACLPNVDAGRLGIVGHSYGGKWALFAGAFSPRFAAVAVSDPGIVWDENRPNVNYWEPWYLGLDPTRKRSPGVVRPDNPRTGAYKELVESGHDLHELLALIAPRPFLLSGGAEDPPERWRALNHAVAANRLLGFVDRVFMTSRPKHDPTADSNEQIYAFFETFLGTLRN